jgi:hypothetical protein
MKIKHFSIFAVGFFLVLTTGLFINFDYPAPPIESCWAPSMPAQTDVAAFSLPRIAVSQVITIPVGAASEVISAAQSLKSVLDETLAANFQIHSGDAKSLGIFIGTSADAPVPAALKSDQGFFIQSTNQQLQIIGKTKFGVEHGVWDLLHQLGYRRYFPGSDWRILPNRFAVRVNRFCQPAFVDRSMGYGFSTWDETGFSRLDAFSQWKKENRWSEHKIQNSHAYQTIISDNQAWFDANPGARGKNADGSPSQQLCVTYPGVADVAIQWARKRLKMLKERAVNNGEDPDLVDSISMEASDGGGFDGCTTDDEQLKTHSNRVVYLANKVAANLNSDSNTPLYVGILAYNSHSEPPTIKIHPNVVVTGTDGFIHFDGSLEEMLQAWRVMSQSSEGTKIGVYEYYSVEQWDRSLPSRAKASQIPKLIETLQSDANAGAKYFNAESSDNWGPNGIGMWMTSGLLWSPLEAQPASYYRWDFFRVFGPANPQMADFYALINPRDDSKNLLVPGLAGEMYRRLQLALQVPGLSDAQLKRIRILVLYARYVELYQKYQSQSDVALRQAAFETLIKYVLSIRDYGMVHSYGLLTEMITRDHLVTLTDAEQSRNVKINPWLDPALKLDVSSSTVDGWLSKGVTLPPYDVSSPTYSSTVLPRAGQSTEPIDSTGRRSMNFVGNNAEFRYYARGPGTLKLWHKSSALKDRSEILFFCAPGVALELCPQTKLAADKTEREVDLSVSQKGVYKIIIQNGPGFTLSWEPGQAISAVASYTSPSSTVFGWNRYVYVPVGTTSFRVFNHQVKACLPSAQPACATQITVAGPAKGADILEIKVPAGEDGKIWKLSGAQQFILFGIPPYAAVSPDELLVPANAP